MPIRKLNPTSPGQRFQTVQVFDEITATKPHKPLTEPIHSSGGRNNRGQLTSWWRGGGHKRTYRIIDFKRDKHDIPAKVASVRTSIAHGKVKRQGRFAGRRSDWKKAFVKLRDGQKMPEFLEGA